MEKCKKILNKRIFKSIGLFATFQLLPHVYASPLMLLHLKKKKV